MKKIAVFCGSSKGNRPEFMKMADEVGKTLVAKGYGLVYGGANIGLMGAVANGVLEAGGEAIGVLPTFMRTKEIAHRNLTELIMVETMHERKMKMHELCDGVVAIPGGFGTMEELFEVLTWAQLGLHEKPIGLLNADGYYNGLLQMADNMKNEGFLQEKHYNMLLYSTHIDDLLEQMENYKAPEVDKWLRESRT